MNSIGQNNSNGYRYSNSVIRPKIDSKHFSYRSQTQMQQAQPLITSHKLQQLSLKVHDLSSSSFPIRSFSHQIESDTPFPRKFPTFKIL